MSEWSLIYEGFDSAEEGTREALCTLGNGYFATRGAASEAEADAVHYPGTYVAGAYNRLRTELAGRIVENEDLVNMPNWLPLEFRLDGNWFNLLAVEILSYRQELNLREGVLLRDLRFQDKAGRRCRLCERRLVHMGSPHLAALELSITAENWSGEVKVCSALDGRVVNAGVERYRGLSNRHLQVLETGAGDETLFLKARTRQSELTIAEACRTRIFLNGEAVRPVRAARREADYVAHEFAVELEQEQQLRIEKTMALLTSRDRAISECGSQARVAVVRAGGFEELRRSHILAWKVLWHRFDIHGELSDPAEGARVARILRLHIFHLLQTVSLHTSELDIGVPARGWHGEAYRGHVFWDELFIFPLFNLRMPEITRELLMYRYRRLDEARAAAREAGLRGAMYPWQSGSSGREETQRLHLNPRSGRWLPDNSRLQYHVNAAVAYNVWGYYQVTHDREFLSYYGAEMILEIARFWASLASFNPEIERYEIRGVMGPDEYHEGYPEVAQAGLNNNTYTNLMAVWVLCRALDLMKILPAFRCKELCEMLDLDAEELAQWDDISRRMRLVFHRDGILSQFEGYEQLDEFDWEGYRKKYHNIQRLDRILEAEGDTPNRYKLSKQADVLMLFYLFSAEELDALFQRLGYAFDHAFIPKTIEYYLDRTSHGSTLSYIVHSWILARSNREHAWLFFSRALASDISDLQDGTTREGIHLGAMAGTVDLVQRCFTGIETRQGVLWLNPCLPDELKWQSVRINYRKHPLEIYIGHEKLCVKSRRSDAEPVRIGVRDQVYQIDGGERREFVLA